MALCGWLLAPCFQWLRRWFNTALPPTGGNAVPFKSFGIEWVKRDDVFFAIGLSLAVNTVYIVVNGFFFVVERWNLLSKYKLPRYQAQEPSSSLIQSTLVKAAIAHFVTAPILMVFVVGPFLRYRNPNAADLSDLPSFLLMWRQLFLIHIINETWFYWGHRLLHSKYLYKTIHKQHHTYLAPRSFSAEYAHVVEDVLTAYVPFLLGLFINGSHFHVVNIWFMTRLVETYEAHSGYCFRGSWLQNIGLTNSSSSAHHWAHHIQNRGNFGNEAFDWCFGTMDAWVAIGQLDGLLVHHAKKANRRSKEKAG